MSLLPAHPRRNGGADDERPTDDARSDGERPATEATAGEAPAGETGQTGQTGLAAPGRSPERPRYAFAYAPAEEAPYDDPRAAEPAVTRPNPVPPTVPVPTVARPTVEAAARGVNRSGPGGDRTPVPGPRAATEREPAGADTADAAGLDEPLLADAAALRARWQRAQSDFVDDPRAAVADAAALVAQTAQAMIDALEQRQRLLRREWERGQQRERGRGNGRGTDYVPGDPGDPGDTERLRLTMRAYRALFNQICTR